MSQLPLRTLLCAASISFIFSAPAAPITRIWLTHRTNEPTTLMVNWESKAAGTSRVEYGPSEQLGQSVDGDGAVLLHHVEIPFPQEGVLYYRVSTGADQSSIHPVKSYSGDTLRVAMAANWYLRPSLDALLKDDPHVLLSCGDMVFDVVPDASGDPVNTKPFSNLIEIYPELFARVPYLPALGNHGRQIRYLSGKADKEPQYDLEARAFRAFFPLPDDGRYYHFDIPAFGLRLAALDLSHVRDAGTPRQSCSPFDVNSAQFRWYRDLMRGRTQRFVFTYYNEANYTLRGLAKGAWETQLRQGSAAFSGFGSFAERGESRGFPYFNSGLKAGEPLRDHDASKFFAPVASYILVSIPKEGPRFRVELKALNGTTLDESEWGSSAKPGNIR